MDDDGVVAEAGAIALDRDAPQDVVAIDGRVLRLLRPVQVVPVERPDEGGQRRQQVARRLPRAARGRRRQQEHAARAVEHPLRQPAHERRRLGGRQHLRQLAARRAVEQDHVLRIDRHGDQAAAHGGTRHASGRQLVPPAHGLRPRVERDDAAGGAPLRRPDRLHDQVDRVRVDVVAGEPLVAGERVLPQHGAVADVARDDDGRRRPPGAAASRRAAAVDDDVAADRDARRDVAGLRPHQARGRGIVGRHAWARRAFQHQERQAARGRRPRLRSRQRGGDLAGVAGPLVRAGRAGRQRRRRDGDRQAQRAARAPRSSNRLPFVEQLLRLALRRTIVLRGHRRDVFDQRGRRPGAVPASRSCAPPRGAAGPGRRRAARIRPASSPARRRRRCRRARRSADQIRGRERGQRAGRAGVTLLHAARTGAPSPPDRAAPPARRPPTPAPRAPRRPAAPAASSSRADP